MDQGADPSGGENPVEGMQDNFLLSQHRASIASEHLSEMVERQRTQAEAVVALIGNLRDQVRASEMARLTAEDDNRRLLDRNADLERQLRLMQTNYERLSAGYNAMMQVVENTHTSSVGLNQRIEAMLLQNDLGISPRASAPPARRIDEFREGAFAHPARHQHPQSDFDRREIMSRVPHVHGYDNGQFSTYGSEGAHAQPLTLRNER
jgi:hypothetical protein